MSYELRFWDKVLQVENKADHYLNQSLVYTNAQILKKFKLSPTHKSCTKTVSRFTEFG